MKTRMKTVAPLGALTVAAALAGGASQGQLQIYAGTATVSEGDVYDQLFIGDTAQVFMDGGVVLGDAIAVNGGQIFISGGRVEQTVRSISATFSTAPSEIFITGGAFGMNALDDGAIAIGGLSEVTIRGTEFFYDHDRDGVSDEPLDLGQEGALVIRETGGIFDAGVTPAIDGLRFMFADGTSETVDVFTNNTITQEWTGFLRLELVGASPADLTGDGVVNAADLAALLAGWGPCGTSSGCATDLDNSGATDAADLAGLLAAWGV